MRTTSTLICVLAASLSLAACGGGDEPQETTTTATTPTTETTETTPPIGGSVDRAAFGSCVEAAGLTTEPEPDEVEGLIGKGLKVPLGEADFDDPSQTGTFGFFAHVYVFENPANAERFNDLATGSRFQDGEVIHNAYVGYNTDREKVPDTPNGGEVLDCLR
jgi:hypothetical protein